MNTFGLSVVAGTVLTALGASLPAPEESGIEHIVVVMMENRSFDHMLGWVPGAEAKQAGLSYPDRSGNLVPTYPLAPDYQGCGHTDPDHSYEGGRIQLNNGACDGWLLSGRSDEFAIGYYTQSDLPFYAFASTNWTICDNYFSAIMAGTFPNRIYQHSAQTDRLSNTLELCQLPTIWDRLDAKGLSGRYYFSDLPMLALWGVKYVPILRRIDSFFEDCAAGNLPQVSYVEPRFLLAAQGLSGDDHPFADVRDGQAFLAKVHNAIVSSPKWTNTVLVINYDEWGGFFDHVPPGTGPVPEADRAAGDTSGLRGFRVPCVIVSPWSGGGRVVKELFDHNSVLKMIEWRWDLEPLTVRDRTAKNLAEALDFNSSVTGKLVEVPAGPFSQPCPVTPLLSLSSTNLILEWSADARLQTANSLLGPWETLTNQSPASLSFTNEAGFFRIANKWDRLWQFAKSIGVEF